MLERGATARASNRIGDAINTATTPLSLRHIASSARVTLVRHRPLVDVVQVLSTLVDVRVHEAARRLIALVSLLMQAVVLAVHDEGRVVVANTATLYNLAKRFLKPAADLDVADAGGGRAGLAHLISSLSIACGA